MYKFLLMGLLPRPTTLHYISPSSWCQLASICNHTDIPECGQQTKQYIDVRKFIDECDMLEYNCDYHKDYNKVDMLNCEQNPTKFNATTEINTETLLTEPLPIQSTTPLTAQNTDSTLLSRSSPLTTPVTEIITLSIPEATHSQIESTKHPSTSLTKINCTRHINHTATIIRPTDNIATIPIITPTTRTHDYSFSTPSDPNPSTLVKATTKTTLTSETTLSSEKRSSESILSTPLRKSSLSTESSKNLVITEISVLKHNCTRYQIHTTTAKIDSIIRNTTTTTTKLSTQEILGTSNQDLIITTNSTTRRNCTRNDNDTLTTKIVNTQSSIPDVSTLTNLTTRRNCTRNCNDTLTTKIVFTESNVQILSTDVIPNTSNQDPIFTPPLRRNCTRNAINTLTTNIAPSVSDVTNLSTTAVPGTNDQKTKAFTNITRRHNCTRNTRNDNHIFTTENPTTRSNTHNLTSKINKQTIIPSTRHNCTRNGNYTLTSKNVSTQSNVSNLSTDVIPNTNDPIFTTNSPLRPNCTRNANYTLTTDHTSTVSDVPILSTAVVPETSNQETIAFKNTTTAYNCTRNDNHILTTEISTTNSTTHYLTTKISKQSPANATIPSTHRNCTKNNNHKVTTKMRTISKKETQISTEKFTKPITITEASSATVERTTIRTTVLNEDVKLSPVPCENYPKECRRPSTWETTSQGETRDFYQILRARFGNRIRVLKATTHWPVRAPFIVNDQVGTFMFGRHDES